MNAQTMFAAGLLLVSAPALGQSNRQAQQQNPTYFASITSRDEDYLQRAVKLYELLLRSDNDGVVESAIAHLTYFRMGSPNRDLKEARTMIVGLAESGRTPVIRYKAYLASVVFETPELFAQGVNAESNQGDQFFLEISSRVQKSLLGENVK